MIHLDDWQKKVLETKGSIILCAGRQVGKSTIIAMRDGKRACENPNESILIISSTERQAQEIFYKTLNFIQANYPRMIRKGRFKPTKHIIYLTNGSIIRCLPTGIAGTGIRGFTLTKLTGEEASNIPDEVWTAVTPMLLTTGGDMDLLGTPKGAQGYFYECYKNEFGEFTVFHINSEEVMNNRPINESWTEKKKQAALLHLEKEKRKMSQNEYAQEYLGVFVDDLYRFFPDELIKKCMTQNRRNSILRGQTYFLGVDIARMGDDESTFEIIDRTDRKKLIHVESLITKKTMLNETTKKIIELERQYHFKKIYLDDGGIGVGVFDYLLEASETKRKVIALNNRSRPLDSDETSKKKILKEDLYNNLLGLMERGEIELLMDDEILESFRSVQYEYVKKAGSTTSLRIFGSYTHIVEGLIRACWCVRDKTLNLWAR